MMGALFQVIKRTAPQAEVHVKLSTSEVLPTHTCLYMTMSADHIMHAGPVNKLVSDAGRL